MHSPGTCPREVGPGRLRWASPRLSGCRPPSAGGTGGVAGPRVLPQRCVRPTLCCHPRPSASPVLSPPAPHRTNSTAPQGSPAPPAPRPSLPQPRLSGHPPLSHRGPQPVLPSRGPALTPHQLHRSRLLPSPPVPSPPGCLSLPLAQHRGRLRPCGLCRSCRDAPGPAPGCTPGELGLAWPSAKVSDLNPRGLLLPS